VVGEKKPALLSYSEMHDLLETAGGMAWSVAPVHCSVFGCHGPHLGEQTSIKNLFNSKYNAVEL
jgi:hypothetical protein